MPNRRFELFEYRHVPVRMRQGDSDRDIARGGLMGRKKLTTVRRQAEARGWHDPVRPLPDDAVIAGVLVARRTWRTPACRRQSHFVNRSRS
jgi:hypothetical protein